MFVCLKRPKINEKKGRGWPIFNHKRIPFFQTCGAFLTCATKTEEVSFHFALVILQERLFWRCDWLTTFDQPIRML